MNNRKSFHIYHYETNGQTRAKLTCSEPSEVRRRLLRYVVYKLKDGTWERATVAKEGGIIHRDCDRTTRASDRGKAWGPTDIHGHIMPLECGRDVSLGDRLKTGENGLVEPISQDELDRGVMSVGICLSWATAGESCIASIVVIK